MADKRKLQGEIERCMKKVTEGVETFEDIWQKVHNATSANQKEKYEADLKKEIKKLQRLRDQIKTWLTSNDIKDKRELMEKRKLIETQMERFKVIERETKMKAYSKEGLGLATKVDPAQKEKEEVRQWLMDCLNDLQMQIDQFESEIESLHAGTKKKKLDRDRQDRVDELADWVERHRFHIKKLENIMRMMDNCSMETEEVKSIQDDINYYVESNQEPDFAENELIYEDLSLDDAPNAATHFPPEDEVTSPVAHSPSSSGPLSPKTPTSIKSTSQELFEDRRRGKTSVSSDGGSEIVPQSPRRPGPKSLLQNSSNPSRQPILKTPTPTASAKTLKASSLPLQSPHTVAAQKPSGNNGASTPSSASVVQPPHAYAVAAGGNQTPHPASTPLTPQPPSLLGSQPDSEVALTTPSLPHPPVALPHPMRGSLESSGSYSQQHSRSSSSSSSLSPSFTPSSTQDTQAPSLSLASTVTSVTSAAVAIATSTGAGTSVAHDSNSTPSSMQSAMSPSLSSFSVSVNSSPGESPATQTAPSLSPIHVAQLGPASLPISSTAGGQITSSQSGSSLSGRALTRTDSSGSGNGGIGVTTSSISAPSILSPGLNQPPGGLGGLGIGDPQSSVASSGSSSAGLQGMTSSLSNSFNFPSRSSSSFSPTSTIASAISAAMSSASPLTNPGTPFDNFRFPVTAPSPPVSDSIVVAQGLSSLKSIAAEVVASHDLLEENKSEDQDQVIRPTLDPSVAAPGSRLESMLAGGFGGTGGGSNRVDPQLQPLLGVAPLGPIPLSSDRVVQLRMLESSYKHLPQLSDSERVRPYLQRNPYPTSHHHHQHPPPLMDTFEFYQRLSIESLFFMFYYMEGTKAQYMAAKALKKLSWRFHTKYMTWFQRLEEPKAITDEYEMGTYIYFDYEKWAQRKKDGFTFEYRFLEDRELP